MVADREMVESEADKILAGADHEDVAFLVVGDPFGCAPVAGAAGGLQPARRAIRTACLPECGDEPGKCGGLHSCDPPQGACARGLAVSAPSGHGAACRRRHSPASQLCSVCGALPCCRHTAHLVFPTCQLESATGYQAVAVLDAAMMRRAAFAQTCSRLGLAAAACTLPPR